MKLSSPWFLFYGMKEFGMTRKEVMSMRFGEFMDLLSCLSVYKGFAKEKHRLSFDEIMQLR